MLRDGHSRFDTMARGLAMGLLLWFALPALAQAAPDKADAKAKVDALSTQIQALSKRLDTTREARSDASQQLEKVETALGEINRRLDDLQAERRQLDDEVASLESQRQALQGERDEQLAALRTQIDALYRLGQAPQLKLLLNQDDPAHLDRLQTYLNALSRARNARLDALTRLDHQLAENRAELDTRRQRLDTLADELDTQSEALAKRRRERQSLLAELDARYTSQQARMGTLNRDRAHAEKVLDQIRKELARLKQPPPSTAIAKTQGKLPWPVQGRILSSFGKGDGVNRNGLVIAAAEGTAVKAIHAGRVVFADWMRGFGNLLILDHGDDIMSLYAHVQRFRVGVGEHVASDDVIAAVGSTGGRSSPALYFEVRRGGEPIDPRQWIGQR